MEKRYQVFVSSTFTDLKDERSKVIQTIMELDCIPAGMEIFPAIDEEQFNFIKRVIDDCDYYLLIIGGRYGSVSEKGVSYTEMEYDYAIEKELKVIAFIHSSPESIPLGKSEIDEIARQKLQMFKEKVAEGRLIKHWKDALDLPGLVLSSLSQTIKRYPATGWVRANELRSPMLTEEFAVLTRENRELKAELEKYNQKNLSRPKIEVFANDSREIQLSIEKTRNWDLCLHVDEKDIPHNILIQLPENYVNLYNESVDDNIEIAQEYNENCKLYNAKKKEIVFSVHNIGSAKANILYIDIEVPEDLKIISQDEAEQISLNWPQKILMHPVNKAFEKTHKAFKNSILDRPWIASNRFGAVSIPGIRPLIAHNSEKWQSLRGNMLSLFRKELLHTRTSHFEKVLLAGLEIGEYELKINCICEEFSEPELTSIKVNVIVE